MSQNEAGPSGANQDKAEATLPKLFVDEQGNPIKFYLQSGWNGDFRIWLEESITSHGGVVTGKVPLVGYILIDPRSDVGKETKKKWVDPNRPQRFIVLYTFVRACIINGGLIDASKMENAFTLFTHNGDPLQVHIHKSISSGRAKKLNVDIDKYGGNSECSEADARFIIADDQTPDFKLLEKRYDGDNEKFIENVSWVSACIQSKKCQPTIKKKNMGGRPVGSARTDFNREDKQNLIQYIATKIPRRKDGGRSGNGLYKELCENTPQYPWAARHSWQSWRTHYKANQLIFDVAIKKYVKEHPELLEAEDDHYSLKRKPKPGKRKRIAFSDDDDDENDDDDSEDEDEVGKAMLVESDGESGKAKPAKQHRKGGVDDVENVNIVDRLNAEATPSQDYLRAREYIDKKKREKEERDLGIVKIGARVHVRDSESPIKDTSRPSSPVANDRSPPASTEPGPSRRPANQPRSEAKDISALTPAQRANLLLKQNKLKAASRSLPSVAKAEASQTSKHRFGAQIPREEVDWGFQPELEMNLLSSTATSINGHAQRPRASSSKAAQTFATDRVKISHSQTTSRANPPNKHDSGQATERIKISSSQSSAYRNLAPTRGVPVAARSAAVKSSSSQASQRDILRFRDLNAPNAILQRDVPRARPSSSRHHEVKDVFQSRHVDPVFDLPSIAEQTETSVFDHVGADNDGLYDSGNLMEPPIAVLQEDDYDDLRTEQILSGSRQFSGPKQSLFLQDSGEEEEEEEGEQGTGLINDDDADYGMSEMQAFVLARQRGRAAFTKSQGLSNKTKRRPTHTVQFLRNEEAMVVPHLDFMVESPSNTPRGRTRSSAPDADATPRPAKRRKGSVLSPPKHTRTTSETDSLTGSETSAFVPLLNTRAREAVRRRRGRSASVAFEPEPNTRAAEVRRREMIRMGKKRAF